MRSPTLLLLLVSTGCLRSVPIDGAPCPCPGAGYLCCPSTGTCIPAGQSCGGGDAAAGGSPGADAGGPALPAQDDLPGPTPLHRLTTLELRNTLRDLLGSAPAADIYVPDDFDYDTGFSYGGIGDSLNPMVLHEIRRIAEGAADLALRTPAAIIPCDPVPAGEDDQEACARDFIARFGLRAYRRPVDDAELEGLLALYRAGRSAGSASDFLGAIRLVIQGMLQSPFFLYRWEVAPPLVRDGALVRLGPYEIASRLSYALWATMPDAALFAAAAANELATPAQLEGQARRLLADPRAGVVVSDFYSQLLDTTQLQELVKAPSFDFGPEVARSMQAETAAFVGDLMVGPAARGSLQDLLTASTSFVDANLARIYAVPAPPSGTMKVDLGPQRAGLLTQLAFLSASVGEDSTNLAHRGRVVFENLLCQITPQITATIPPITDVPPPGISTRHRYEMEIAGGCTEGCHPIYPLGWAFENYGPIGAYRTMEAGATEAIDPSGSIPLPSGLLAWQTATELARRLADLPEVRDCAVKKWLRYLIGRKEGPGDARSLALASDAFARSSYVLRELVVGLVTSRAFSHRTPSPGEVLP
jgi:hypothetical protein